MATEGPPKRKYQPYIPPPGDQNRIAVLFPLFCVVCDDPDKATKKERLHQFMQQHKITGAEWMELSKKKFEHGPPPRNRLR